MSLPDQSIRPLGRPDAGWRFTLYPEAGEGGGCFVPSFRPVRDFVPAGSAADPDRAAVEASRRARATLRRYCAANRLNRLGTLTYAKACHEPAAIRSDLRVFFKNLREAVGDPFPYAWVPEWHKTGHGLHAHFAVGRFIQRGLIEQAWGHGFVHIKLLGGVPVGSGALSEARRAAGYLSKYVAKSFADERRLDGLHRYDVGQGFQPEALALTGHSSWEVLEQASEYLSGQPSTVWSSAQREDWPGPPAVWAQWGR